MANYLQFGQALAKHLPMTEGCTSTVKLGKKGIEALSKKNPELGKVIEGMDIVHNIENVEVKILEKEGFIHKFSLLILEKVCMYIKQLEHEKINFDGISVNFSLSEFLEENFENDILNIVQIIFLLS